MKICLAASGGGHVRQLLDLAPVWRHRRHLFVTEPTALGHSIAADHPTAFVPHFALGQARLGHPVRMIRAAMRNALASLRIIWRERPDLVVSTGAGSMLFIVLFARLLGARVVIIDSFARFDGPSAFARLAGRLAHIRIAQSEGCGRAWRADHVFDPFRRLDGPRPEKRDLLFATVGATLPFDRLVDYVAMARQHGALPADVLVQVGEGGRCPDGLSCLETLDFATVRDTLDVADIVVCHGGTGSLVTALRAGCRVIAVPRLFALGEHYDDHQLEITRAFADRGLIQVATDEPGFLEALAAARLNEPVMATTDPAALIAFLDGWIEENVAAS